MKFIPSLLACAAGLLSTLGGASAAPCRDGAGTGAWVYTGLNVPHFADSLTVRCAPQSSAGNISGTGTYSYGTDPVTLGLSASAFGEPGSVHVKASSQVLSGGRSELLTNAYPAFAVAHAESSLVFTLNAPSGTAPRVLAPVEFDLVGGGRLAGERGAFQGYGAWGLLFPSNGIRWQMTGRYQDSDGVVKNTPVTSGSSNPYTTGGTDVEFWIELLGMFEAGQNYFQLQMDVVASGNALADFSHTASIAGIRVAEGYSLTLPDGLFSVDPADPRHYVLNSLLPQPPDPTVPEPATLALVGLAFAAHRLARRRR